MRVNKKKEKEHCANPLSLNSLPVYATQNKIINETAVEYTHKTAVNLVCEGTRQLSENFHTIRGMKPFDFTAF